MDDRKASYCPSISLGNRFNGNTDTELNHRDIIRAKCTNIINPRYSIHWGTAKRIQWRHESSSHILVGNINYKTGYVITEFPVTPCYFSSVLGNVMSHYGGPLNGFGKWMHKKVVHKNTDMSLNIFVNTRSEICSPTDASFMVPASQWHISNMPLWGWG